MTWRPVPLPDGSYTDVSRSFGQQDLVNVIPEPAEVNGTRSPMKLAGAPGLHEYFSVGDGPHRGAHNVEGTLFIVSDTHLYRVNAADDIDQLGTVPGTGLVSMAHNQTAEGQQLVIANGTDKLYTYDLVTSVFAQVTDTDCPGALCVDFINQKIVAVEPEGAYFYNSALADAREYDPFERYVPESCPDRLKAVIVSHLELLAFNERTIEPYEDSADPADIAIHLLFRNKRIVIERGLAATFAVARIDNSVMFLADDRSVYRLDGYSLVRKSNFALENEWRNCDVSQAFAFVYEDRGHKIFYLTFPDGKTWGYDCATDRWHRRESKGLTRWRLNTLVKWNGEWFGGSFDSGMFYQLDWGYYLEADEELSRGGTFAVLHNNGQRATLNGVRLLFESGGTASVADAPVAETVATDNSGVYVTVGDGGKVYTADNASDYAWELQSVPLASPRNILRVEYGNGVYVQTGNGTAPSYNTVRYSADAKTWIDTDFPSYASSPGGLCFDPVNGLFVCVADVGSTFDGKIFTSPDGETWTERTAPTGCGPLQKVEYGDGIVFACSTDGKVIYSTDCINWTKVDVTTAALYGVAYGSGVYMTVGEEVWTSPDCVTWTLRETLVGYVFLDVAHEQYAKFFAVANGGAPSQGIWRSTDLGDTWTREDSTADCVMCYGNDDPDWGYAYVGTVGGLLGRNNGLNTWAPWNINVGYNPYSMVIVVP